jgi:hypothetical protein
MFQSVLHLLSNIKGTQLRSESLKYQKYQYEHLKQKDVQTIMKKFTQK